MHERSERAREFFSADETPVDSAPTEPPNTVLRPTAAVRS